MLKNFVNSAKSHSVSVSLLLAYGVFSSYCAYKVDDKNGVYTSAVKVPSALALVLGLKALNLFFGEKTKSSKAEKSIGKPINVSKKWSKLVIQKKHIEKLLALKELYFNKKRIKLRLEDKK